MGVLRKRYYRHKYGYQDSSQITIRNRRSKHSIIVNLNQVTSNGLSISLRKAMKVGMSTSALSLSRETLHQDSNSFWGFCLSRKMAATLVSSFTPFFGRFPPFCCCCCCCCCCFCTFLFCCCCCCWGVGSSQNPCCCCFQAGMSCCCCCCCCFWPFWLLVFAAGAAAGGLAVAVLVAQLRLEVALPQTQACAKPISFWRAFRSFRSLSTRSRSCRSSSAWISARDLVAAEPWLEPWLPLDEAALAQLWLLLA